MGAEFGLGHCSTGVGMWVNLMFDVPATDTVSPIPISQHISPTWGPQMLLMWCCPAETQVARSAPDESLRGICGVESGAKRNSVSPRKSPLFGVTAKLQ